MHGVTAPSFLRRTFPERIRNVTVPLLLTLRRVAGIVRVDWELRGIPCRKPSPSSLHEPGRPTAIVSRSRKEIRHQLSRRFWQVRYFSGSRRCQQFLEHVCQKSLAGEGGAYEGAGDCGGGFWTTAEFGPWRKYYCARGRAESTKAPGAILCDTGWRPRPKSASRSAVRLLCA